MQPCFPCIGEPGLAHTGAHQGQPAERVARVLRPRPAADIRTNGEGLVPALPAVRALHGPGQPEEAAVHGRVGLVEKERGRE